ncbi:MAG: type II toxin-antitoxin system PemK/MazF family toxin [Chloroflexi bacterium]|nr:type II toxin-antitoxin system PemK/MazF family toxin [Chloroflexota bacterium]
MLQVRRGDIFNVNFGTRAGHEQEGLRPAIVVQSDFHCDLATLWVIPTSTRAHPDVDYHVPVTIQGQRALALIEQLTMIQRPRIKPENYLGHLTTEEMEEISDMMRIFGGLDPHYGLRF